MALVPGNKDSLKNVAKSRPADQVMVQAADVSGSSAVDGIVAAVVHRFGRLDVIVNNAGVHEGGDPTSITDEKWRTLKITGDKVRKFDHNLHKLIRRTRKLKLAPADVWAMIKVNDSGPK